MTVEFVDRLEKAIREEMKRGEHIPRFSRERAWELIQKYADEIGEIEL